MTQNISLRPVTRENFDDVAHLRVHDHQRSFLADNAYSVAQASFNDALQPRAIYSDELLVGFLMYAYPEPHDAEPGCYAIWRFMVDQRYQRQGIGGKALQRVMNDIWRQADARKLFITYLPANRVARAFYARHGFRETGLDPASGEMEAMALP